MDNIQVVMNNAGCTELRNSNGVQVMILDEVKEWKGNAEGLSEVPNCEYTCDVQAGKTRAHAMLKATNPQSVKDNLRNNTLLKAMR